MSKFNLKLESYFEKLMDRKIAEVDALLDGTEKLTPWPGGSWDGRGQYIPSEAIIDLKGVPVCPGGKK